MVNLMYICKNGINDKKYCFPTERGKSESKGMIKVKIENLERGCSYNPLLISVLLCSSIECRGIL